MNKKGFTLIELLAVIIVLAIIALITTPMILGVIEKSKKGSAVSSMYGYIDAIEKQIALSTLSSKNYEDKEYAYDEIEVSVKGNIPTAGIYELEKSKVKNAVFCLSGYIVTYSNNIAQAGEKCNPDDLKYDSSIKLSSSTGTYTYPETGTVEVIENISGGELSCSSSDEGVASCSIDGITITIKSGTKEGTTTITVKSKSTSKYKEAQAAYVVTTEKGTLSVTASDKTVTYDGEAHGIIVTSSGATVKYKDENGNYTLDESSTYKDAGIYTIYYQVTKEGYKTVTSSKTLIINPAEGNVVLSETEGIVYVGETKTFIVSEATGELSCISNNEDVATCLVENTIVTINGLSEGTAVITINVAKSSNYNAASKTYSLISEKLTSPYTGTLTSNGWTATYVDGQMTSCKYGNYNACTNSSCSSSGLDGCTGDTNTNYYYSYRDTIPIMGTCTSYRYCFMGSPYGTYCDYRYFNYIGECTRHIQYNCNSGAWCSGCETYTSSCQTGTNYSAYYTAKGANLPSYYEE